MGIQRKCRDRLLMAKEQRCCTQLRLFFFFSLIAYLKLASMLILLRYFPNKIAHFLHCFKPVCLSHHEQIHHTTCDFDRTISPDIYISNMYRCLYDQHLRDYYYNQELLHKRKQPHYVPPRVNRVSALDYPFFSCYVDMTSLCSKQSLKL